MFGDLTLDRVKATGHAVWLPQPRRGAKIGCNEMIHEVAPRGGQNMTYFRIDSLRKHWLLEKYDFVEERPQGPDGPSGSGPSRSPRLGRRCHALRQRRRHGAGQPGCSRAGPHGDPPRPDRRCLVAQGVPADRIVTWQNQLMLKNEVRPRHEDRREGPDPEGQTLGLRSGPASPRSKRRTRSSPGSSRSRQSPGCRARTAGPARPARKAGSPQDGGFQIRRLLALNDAHLVAPSKNLTARNRLEVDVRSSRPSRRPSAAASTAPGQRRAPARLAAAERPDGAQQEQTSAPRRTKPGRTQHDRPGRPRGRHDRIARIPTPEAATCPPRRTNVSAAAGRCRFEPTRSATRSSSARVSLHQDPAPARPRDRTPSARRSSSTTKGREGDLQSLSSRSQGEDRGGRRPAPRRPLAQVITEDKTIKGEVIGVNQKTDEAWVYGPGKLIQLTDRNLMTDKAEDGRRLRVPAREAANRSPRTPDAAKAKARTRAGKVLGRQGSADHHLAGPHALPRPLGRPREPSLRQGRVLQEGRAADGRRTAVLRKTS